MAGEIDPRSLWEPFLLDRFGLRPWEIERFTPREWRELRRFLEAEERERRRRERTERRR